MNGFFAGCGWIDPAKEADFVRLPPHGAFNPFDPRRGFWGSAELHSTTFEQAGEFDVTLTIDTRTAPRGNRLIDPSELTAHRSVPGEVARIQSLIDQVPQGRFSSKPLRIGVREPQLLGVQLETQASEYLVNQPVPIFGTIVNQSPRTIVLVGALREALWFQQWPRFFLRIEGPTRKVQRTEETDQGMGKRDHFSESDMIVLQPGAGFDPRNLKPTGERIPLDRLSFPQAGEYRLVLVYCTLREPLDPARDQRNDSALTKEARALLDFVPEGNFESGELVIRIVDLPAAQNP